MSDNNIYNEKELLLRIAEGDEKVFKIFFDKYYRQLVYFAIEISNDLLQAQDATTEAFVKLWNKKETFTSEAHFKNYLFLSVKHTCIDFIKSRQLHNKAHIDLRYLADQVEESAEKAMLESEIIRNINEQISNLPDQCRKVFSYFYFDGMSTDQVAKVMNISTKNVLNQKGIALKLLRSKLLKKGLLTLTIGFLKIFF